jgi:hypothetical protein
MALGAGRPVDERDPGPLPSVHPVALAAAVGALWGGAGYAILWGHAPIVVGRRFVTSPLGTVAFLPVRLVLWWIRMVEGWMGRSFELAEESWWIGVVAALAGAVLATGALLLGRLAVRRARRS